MHNWKRLRENPQLWEQFFVREKVIRATRQFFDVNGFHEVEVPLLIAYPPAESYVDVFATQLNNRLGKSMHAYLSTSPEVALKKLLTAGIGNCYCVTKSFRNGETDSKTHNPEFTILEWYRVGAPYEAIMEDCELWVLSLSQSVGKNHRISYQGNSIDLSPPWERITMKEAFGRYAGVDFDRFLDMHSAREIARQKGYSVADYNSWEELYNQIFLNEVESHLGVGKPMILTEFPGSMAALAENKPEDPRYALRFELYIGGLELADCYQELTDPIEQERRFQIQLEEVEKKGHTTYAYDHDFIDALKTGLPRCSGIAVGMDRMMMLLADVATIEDITFFPASQLWEVKS